MELNKYYNLSFENSSTFIKDNSVDMFFLDPPYFISGNRKEDIDLEKGDRTHWDKQWHNKNDYYNWVRTWLKVSYKQLKKTGSIYICMSWEHSGKIQELLEEAGFHVMNRITWKRDKGRGAKRNWKSMMEDVWFAVKDEKSYTFNIKDVMIEKEVIAPYRDAEGNPKDWFIRDGKKIRYTHPGNLWDDFCVPYWSMKEVKSYAKTKKTPNNELNKHNTQKPKELVKRCILASTNESDIIVDYFVGSGTTAIASRELNRNYIVFDINKLCIQMLEKRLDVE